jgi:hypothetical protein
LAVMFFHTHSLYMLHTHLDIYRTICTTQNNLQFKCTNLAIIFLELNLKHSVVAEIHIISPILFSTQ